MANRILILTDSIAAPAYAPRVVTLCAYLSAQGWDCHVFSDCEQGCQPFSAPFGTWHHTAYYQSGNVHVRYIADKLFGARERQFQRHIEQSVNVATFDIICCSTCYYFPLQTAQRLADKYGKPFIVDVRDIAEQWGNISYNTHSVGSSRLLNKVLHRLFTAVNLRARNRVLRAANEVVTVSPWHQDLLSQYNPHTHLIYNGFDAQQFKACDQASDSFVISYAGKIYDLDFRDPRLLFEALRQLIDERRIEPKHLSLIFHIDKASIPALREMIAGYGLEDISSVSGYIPPSEMLPLYYRSSVLLVLTCQSTPEGAHGIMGTKFYEALGVEKPVLCVRSDEECLAQVIRETNAGLAATTAEQVKAFLLDKYREWQKNGFTRQAVIKEQKQRFTRQYQTAQFAQLMDEAIRPQVSVIVPVYNAAYYLTECVNSLINQDTGSPLQIILVDDGSTDNSLAMIRLFADNYAANTHRQVLMLTQAHAGQSAARNLGMQHATGQYVCFVDADDWLEKDFVSTMLTAKSEVVQCGYKRVKNDGTVIQAKHPCHFYRFVSPCMRLYKREILSDMHFPEAMIYEDVIFSLNLWAKHPTHTILPYAGYNYRLNEASTTSRIDPAAQRKLYSALRATRAPRWLKLYTIIRLKIHFRK